MSDIFNSVQVERVKRNKFDKNHRVKGSCKQDFIIPIGLEATLPGSSYRWLPRIFARLTALKSPMLQEMDVTWHAFHVPTRLVWDEAEDFYTGGEEGTAEPVFPQLTINSDMTGEGLLNEGTLADHFGLPVIGEVEVDQEVNISAIPFRGQQLIWNEYYRDQTLQDKIAFSKASGVVTDINEVKRLMTIRKKAFKKDYFTSALPSPQRGEAVTIPIEGIAEVTYMANSLVRDQSGVASYGGLSSDIPDGTMTVGTNGPGRVENIESISVNNVVTTIEDLRTAIITQRILELAARVGSRYTEYLRGFWDVTPEDYRLQRPEYLGGSWAPMQISEVLQTMQDEGTNPLGHMGGHGIATVGRNRFKYYAKEHGYIHIVLMFTSKAAYFQGIPRHFRLFDRFDWPLPQTAMLGEQAIKRGELWYDPQGIAGEVDETFGYIPRFSEFKYIPSRITGQMRTDLLYWHQARKFENKPVLNGEFITSYSDPRVFAVDDDIADPIYYEVTHTVDAILPLPYYGVPGITKI